MKIGSSHHSVSALSSRANGNSPLSRNDDDAQGEERRLPIDTTLTGAQTVAAPALAQALWDSTIGMSVDAPFLSADAAKQAKVDDGLHDDLQKWATMTVAEKIRAQYLENKGLSESDLAAMPADDRKAIEDEIAKAVKQALGIRDEAADTSNAKPI